MGLITKLFGTRSEREIKKLMPLVEKTEALEESMRKLSDSELRGKTEEFKARYAAGETLEELLPEAFAVCREASDRVLGMRHFQVQLIGGIVLHQGRIAEMKTGEGKTLVATLPAYLNAIAGRGVHIVTVNDYLARRDSEWMGKVYRFLGLSVGLIVHGLTNAQRKAAYDADITYCTNNELGFDYLRDNMALYKSQMVQRGHAFAIVDEVDSILIDEARTPLIISGQGDESTDLYRKADDFVSRLRKKVYASVDEKADTTDEDADYIVDEKARTATLTGSGVAKAEQTFGLENYADIENATLSHHINQALKAHGIMKRDVDYVVRDGEIIIVDEFTGRLMFGRRYSEGLHQAIEAKEHVDVQSENKTLATITFQNFFRLYDKLSGMTGTALTEEEEFGAIYNIDIVEIPTNRPLARVDNPDAVYKNDAGKNRAVIRQIIACHEKGQPVLVGTVSIEKSEYLSKLLAKQGIKHNVLNAKNHEKEAEIIAQAGKLGAVTISTNMAGRGTDIVLGGNAEFMARADLRREGIPDEIISEAVGFAETDNADILAAREKYGELLKKYKAVTDAEAEQVRAAGGLFVLGTERHEARRIDNQLRGRSGRQGDPGETRFYIALSDDLMRLFGGDRIEGLMETLRIDEDTPIDQRILSGAIENAQKKVESQNFQSRKHVLEYDDVMNTQRGIIYEQRRRVLDGEDVSANIRGWIREVIAANVTTAMAPEAEPENGKHKPEPAAMTGEKLVNMVKSTFLALAVTPQDVRALVEGGLETMSPEEITQRLTELAEKVYDRREAEAGTVPATGQPVMREVERVILLRVVDEYWMDHIDAMSELRQGIRLRAYAQVNPVDEYKREGGEMFDAMINGIQEEVVRRMFAVRLTREQPIERRSVAKNAVAGANAGGSDVKKKPVKVVKIGRNDPCPCGSGLKWKKCTCKEYHPE